MPGHDKPPADFLATAEKMSTTQLERSLVWMKDKAATGDRVAQHMVGWTEDVLEARAQTENQLVLGADGHTYTQRQYREKAERDGFQAGQGALTGNFASALVFQLTGDPHLAGLVGGLFSAAGGTAKGFNEMKAVGGPDPASVNPPTGSPPPRDVEPTSPSQPPMPGGANSSETAPTEQSQSAPVGGISELEWITWKDVLAFAEAVFGVPEPVVAATRELTADRVPVSEATADFLSLFAVAAREDGADNGDSPPNATDDVASTETGTVASGDGAAWVTPGEADADEDGVPDMSVPQDEADAAGDDATAMSAQAMDATTGSSSPGLSPRSPGGDLLDDDMDRDDAGADEQVTLHDGQGAQSSTSTVPAADSDLPYLDDSPGDDGETSYLDDGEQTGDGEEQSDEGQMSYLDDDDQTGGGENRSDEGQMSYLDDDGGQGGDGAPGEECVQETPEGDYSSSDGGDGGGGEGAVVVQLG